jgi:hypothetical protein
MLSYEVVLNELLLPFEVDGHSISFAQIWVVMGYSDVVAPEDKVPHGEDFGTARLWFVTRRAASTVGLKFGSSLSC